MKFQHSRYATLIALLGLAVAAVSPAATPPEKQGTGAAYPKGSYAALNALPDWGGVWVLARPRQGAPPRERPTFKGEYLKRYENWQKQVRDNHGVVTKDTSNCMPPGMPNMMGTGQYPIEFLFTPGRVTTLHEAWMQTRTIFTDGRGHPEDLEPGIFGDSIGRWEGDTLVIETVGIKTITELGAGMKHSDKLKIVERMHLAAGDPQTLLIEMTIDDPEALEKPYKITHTYTRQRDWKLMEFICAENDRNPVDASGHTKFE
ncbi:MAG: hypothetical protein ABI859_09860 [Pseudomonadota bacterium]